MKKIVPANGYVVVKSKEAVSEILLAKTGEERQETGEIIAIGGDAYTNENGVVFGAADLKIGDEIIYKMYADQKVELDGTDYYLIKFPDIIGKVVEDAG